MRSYFLAPARSLKRGIRLSATPGVLTGAAPILGADNEYVYREVAGLSEEEFVELLVDGAFD